MNFKSKEECFVQYLIELKSMDFGKRRLEKGPSDEMIF